MQLSCCSRFHKTKTNVYLTVYVLANEVPSEVDHVFERRQQQDVHVGRCIHLSGIIYHREDTVQRDSEFLWCFIHLIKTRFCLCIYVIKWFDKRITKLFKYHQPKVLYKLWKSISSFSLSYGTRRSTLWKLQPLIMQISLHKEFNDKKDNGDGIKPSKTIKINYYQWE